MTDVRLALQHFEALVDLPPDERAAALRDLAADAPDVHALVLRMLAAEPAATDLFARSPLGIDAVAAARAMPRAELLPRRIGRFELLEVLGAGSSSVVYLAMQDRPHRPVALKVFLGLSAADEALVQREAELQAGLHHPGVVHVYDQGILPDGSPFVAMELVEGSSLSDWLSEAEPSHQERLQVFAAITATVQFLHGQGVLHRDLKPEHIRVETITGIANPRFLDFGVARRLDEPGGTDQGPVGTLGYMSPEQREGHPGIDGRSDLFALGALAVEMFGDAAGRIADPDLSAIVARCRAEDRDERYRDAAALLEDLHLLRTGRAVGARVQPLAARALRLMWRHSRAVLGVVGATTLSILLVYFVRRTGEAEVRLETQVEAVDDMLRDLDQSAGTASQRRVALLRLLAGAEAAASAAPGDEAVRRRLAELRTRLGDLAMEYGDLAEARRQRTAALATWTTLLGSHPRDDATISGWASAQVRLGDVVKAELGAPAARDDYQAAHARLVARAAAAPHDRTALDDLAWSWARLVEVEKLMGDLEAATSRLDRRFEVLARLEGLAPTHPSTLAGKYEAFSQRAELAHLRQDNAAAEAALFGAMDAARTWLAATPDHVLAMVAMVRGSVSLAGHARRRGDLAAAAARLAVADPHVARLALLEPDHERAVEARAAVGTERALLQRGEGRSSEALTTIEATLVDLERWHHTRGQRAGLPRKLVADAHRLAAECATETGAVDAAAAHLAAAARCDATEPR